MAECRQQRYLLAGVQYGALCFCGNELAARAKVAPNYDCEMECTGDYYGYCGGKWRMNVYDTFYREEE